LAYGIAKVKNHEISRDYIRRWSQNSWCYRIQV